MKIHQLLSQKNSWNAVWLHIRDPEAEIAFASPVVSYEDLQSNVLYLCTKEELSPSLDIEGLNFLLISGKDAPGYRFHNCNLLALLHPLEPKEALEQADTLFLSPQLSQNTFPQLHSNFLKELLTRNIRDISTTIRRADMLKIKSRALMQILTIMPENARSKQISLLYEGIKKQYSESYHTLLDERIVFLIINADSPLEQGPLPDLLLSQGVRGSLSRSFSFLQDTYDHYNEALAAWYIGERVSPEETLHAYGQYIFHHIGGILAKEYPLEKFYHPAISSITEYDKKHHTQLLQTLRMHLLHPYEPAKAAQALFIHKNTLFYRINKLKELFELNLNNGDERLSLQLSLKFLEMNSSSGIGL